MGFYMFIQGGTGSLENRYLYITGFDGVPQEDLTDYGKFNEVELSDDKYPIPPIISSIEYFEFDC